MEKLINTALILVLCIIPASGCAEKTKCDYALINQCLAVMYHENNMEKAEEMIMPCAMSGDSASLIILSLIKENMNGDTK